MAIYSSGPVTGSISGKLGGVVFVNAKKQGVVRMRPASQQSISPRQQNSLSVFTGLQQAWADLTDAERLTWRVSANATSISNRLGKSSPPGAFQLFVRENAKIRAVSGTLITIPPVGSRSPPPRTTSVVFSASGTYVVNANPGSPHSAAIFYVYGWQECKKYHTNAPPKFVLLFQQGAPAIGVDIRDEWEAVYGSLAEDQVFTVAISNQTAGLFMSDRVIIRGVTAA